MFSPPRSFHTARRDGRSLIPTPPPHWVCHGRVLPFGIALAKAGPVENVGLPDILLCSSVPPVPPQLQSVDNFEQSSALEKPEAGD